MRTRGLLFLIVFAAAVLPFAGIVGHQFLNWDDPDWITGNPLVQHPGGLARIWTGFEDPQVYPATFTLYWLECRIWGDRPAGYHAVSLLLHGLAAVLLLRFLLQIGLGVSIAISATALFALHPTQAASVAWATEQKNLLSGVFYFAALGEYAAGLRGRKPRRLVQAWILAALALLAKTTTVTLPLTLVLVEWWFSGRSGDTDSMWGTSPAGRGGVLAKQSGGRPFTDPPLRGSLLRRPLFRVAPFFVPAVLQGILTLFREHGPVIIADAGLGDRLLIAGRALWFYVGKLLWPAGLSGLYPRWSIDAARLAGAISWAGILALVALLLFAARRLPRAVPFGMAQFALAALPTSGIVPFGYMEKSWVADHFLYLSSWGFWVAFFSLAGWIAGRVAAGRRREVRAHTSPSESGPSKDRRIGGPPPASGRVVLVIAGVLSACFLPVAAGYARSWSDTETFWNRVLAKDPHSWVAYGNRGQWYAASGRYQEALSDLREALRLHPLYVEADFNLGYVLDRTGRTGEARRAYEQTLRLSPEYPEAHNNLGALLLRSGDLAGARREFEAAAALTPGDPSIEHNFRLLEAAERRAAGEIPAGH